jgi:hypothetical protein
MSVILYDDGDVISETCIRDRKGTTVYTVHANAGSANTVRSKSLCAVIKVV